MATWQPPIPAGAMYSRAAVRLGVALPLLGWCYDAIQRDGWVTINLKDAAADMDVPYQTMKRWWAELRNGPFFADIEDHGRNGYRARFADAWVDWRILRCRPVTEPKGTPASEAPDVTPDEVPDVTPESPQVHVKYTSSTEMVSDVVLEESMYKEDQYTSNNKQQRGKRRADRATVSTEHQALMAAYQGWLGYAIPYGGKEAAAAQKLLKTGYTVEQIENAYLALKAQPFYADKHLSLQVVYGQIGALTTKAHPKRKAPVLQTPPAPSPDTLDPAGVAEYLRSKRNGSHTD